MGGVVQILEEAAQCVTDVPPAKPAPLAHAEGEASMHAHAGARGVEGREERAVGRDRGSGEGAQVGLERRAGRQCSSGIVVTSEAVQPAGVEQ